MMDHILEQAVLSALHLEPSIDVSRILARVRSGVATLTGDVDTHAQKLAAKYKAEGVPGVSKVVDELEVCLAENSRRGFEDVAAKVLNALYWDLAVPSDRVSAKCERGWVTLTGEVDRPYQKTSAEADVRKVCGVVGVTNQISVGSSVKTDAPRRGDAATPSVPIALIVGDRKAAADGRTPLA
jgi:osmotically-inducible protein OsmY